MRQYIMHQDFYNLESDDNIVILKNFQTHQQTTEYTCGPVCLQMIETWLGGSPSNEMEIAKEVNCEVFRGTNLEEMEAYFIRKGYQTESSIRAPKNKSGKIFADEQEFKNFVVENLKQGFPILVENVDYGGHYKVIIGYDSQEDENCDLLIFADPYDDTDGKKDGYHVFPAKRFFYMWFDAFYLSEQAKIQPYIVVKGRK